MKTYKKVELEAVNAPSGSYAAGCPAMYGGNNENGDPRYRCNYCERTR